jgi:hypothetical protein
MFIKCILVLVAAIAAKTDVTSLAGAVEFAEAARQASVRPILDALLLADALEEEGVPMVAAQELDRASGYTRGLLSRAPKGNGKVLQVRPDSPRIG